MKEVTSQSFATDVLASEVPVLVDFWAPWCGPCKALAPTLEAVAAEYDGRVTIVKVNVDEESELASQYGVRGIPSLMLFKGGALVANKVGMIPKPVLTAFIDLNA